LFRANSAQVGIASQNFAKIIDHAANRDYGCGLRVCHAPFEVGVQEFAELAGTSWRYQTDTRQFRGEHVADFAKPFGGIGIEGKTTCHGVRQMFDFPFAAFGILRIDLAEADRPTFSVGTDELNRAIPVGVFRD